MMDRHPGGRLEAGRAAMAEVRGALHEPFAIRRGHAPFMLQGAASPHSASLLVFGDADAFAPQIGGSLDPGIPTHEYVRMEKPAGGEDRQADKPPIAL